ncbi:MAG: hypothetical protein MJ134_07830 [Lachnospiraceae bacterium]|nr:hypothetical protein [Lachnospiraceae bacterium]
MANLDGTDDSLKNDRINHIAISDCEKLLQKKVEAEKKKIRGLVIDKRGLASPLASEESTQISLQYIREQRDGLNKHRESLLNRVPKRESWAIFSLNSIEDKDLAYLSASTGDEFALLRGKKQDILYRGNSLHCHIEKDELLMNLLEGHKICLECHSHPDYGTIVPSQDDRDFIASFGQKSSRIVSSYTGKVITFHANRFDDLYKQEDVKNE